MKFIILETPGMLLRMVNKEVLDHVHGHYSDMELKTFFGHQSDEELEREKFRFKNGYTLFNKSILYFQLLLREEERNIGWCGFHTWYVDHCRAELGYMIYKDEDKGRGYMKEALAPVLNYGFEQMKLHRIEAMIADYNIPSLRLLEHSGFSKEGTLKEHYYINNRYEDSDIYGLLKKNWIFMEQ